MLMTRLAIAGPSRLPSPIRTLHSSSYRRASPHNVSPFSAASRKTNLPPKAPHTKTRIARTLPDLPDDDVVSTPSSASSPFILDLHSPSVSKSTPMRTINVPAPTPTPTPASVSPAPFLTRPNYNVPLGASQTASSSANSVLTRTKSMSSATPIPVPNDIIRSSRPITSNSGYHALADSGDMERVIFARPYDGNPKILTWFAVIWVLTFVGYMVKPSAKELSKARKESAL
jgi:hypothetical protein